MIPRNDPFARHLLQNRSSNWPPPPTELGKKKDQKKMVSTSPVTSTPTTFVSPTEVKLLGRVEGGRTSAGKKKRSDEVSKSSKKKSSSKPTTDNLKSLDDKWSQRFARLEVMLLAKLLAVPVGPVEVVTNDQPFFNPGAGTSKMLFTQPTEVFTSASPVQATRDVSATQPDEAPGMMVGSADSMTATWPVEVPSTRKLATQPVEAPSVRTATQPVDSSGSRTDVHSQPTSTDSFDASVVDRSLTSKKTVTANTGVSDREDELNSEPVSPTVISDQEVLSDRDPAKDNELDQKFSEEANHRETMRGWHSFMGWHQILDFDSSSFSLDNNSLSVPEPSLPGKYPSSYRLMIGCAEC